MLAFDKMKIQESLVFNENTGQMLRFVDIGDINAKLQSFEAKLLDKEEHPPEVATRVISLCVRGIFTRLEYPICQFATICKYTIVLIKI